MKYRDFIWRAGCFFSVAAGASPTLVSTSPQVTELLFQLGRGQDVVATPRYSDYPAAAKRIPLLGPLGFPSVERTLRLAPDWVVIDAPQPVYELGVRALGFPIFSLDLTAFASLVDSARRLLSTIYPGQNSSSLEAYARCGKALAGKRAAENFLAMVWMSPPVLFGHPSFLSSLLVHLGGENILPRGWNLPYPQVGEEWLIKNRPAVLYYLSGSAATDAEIRRLVGKWWPEKNVKLRPLPEAEFSRASFTPLHHLGTLGFSPLEIPGECRAFEL